jgi:hypothetical protein
LARREVAKRSESAERAISFFIGRLQRVWKFLGE